MPIKSSIKNPNSRSTKMDNEPYLDLTYGTGGEQSSQYPDDDDDYADAQQQEGGPSQHAFGNAFDAFVTTAGMGMSDDEVQYEDDDEEMNDPHDHEHQHNNVHHDGLFHYDHHQQQGNAMQTSSASVASGGTAVEEHTGRWTKEEHEAFLQGLQLFGKEWKKVAAKVRTRTVVQTRTHAQKYFQKLQKSVQDGQQASSRRRNAGNGNDEDVDQYHDDETQRMIEIMNSVNPDDDDPLQSLASTSSGTRGRSTRGRGGRRSHTNTPGSQTNSSTRKAIAHQPLLPPPPVAMIKGVLKSTFGGSVTATPHQQRRGSTATLNAAQVMSTLSSAKTSGTPLTMNRSQQLQQHAVMAVGSSHNVHTTPSREQGFFMNNNGMKITAPDPSKMGRLYPFPEPSPAATGKRKLAEIAAAQMLAGVISSNSKPQNVEAATNLPPAGQFDLSLTDGPPTPPISYQESGTFDVTSARPLHLNDAPPLPPLISAGSTSARPTLQIVNPEVFGIVSTSSRNAYGRTSPVTPWDSELNALIGSTAVSSVDEGGDSDETVPDGVEFTDTHISLQQTSVEQENGAHPIRGPVDGYSRTPLHQAVCAQDDETVKTLIDVIGTQSKDLNQCDNAGYTPLHSACCLATIAASNITEEEENDDDKPNHIVRMLLKAGCNPFLLDANGNSPLHWSVRSCDYDATQQLLNLVSTVKTDTPNMDTATCSSTITNDDSEAIRKYVNIPNQLGETCLHWAARGGMRCGDQMIPLLLSYSASPGVVNKTSKRPIDVVAEGYIDEPHSLASLRKHQPSLNGAKQRSNGDGNKKSCDNKELNDSMQRTRPDQIATRRLFLHHSSSLRTLVLHHPECLDHHPKSMSDWETPDRVRTILQRLATDTAQSNTENSSILPDEILLSQEFDRGNLELLSRVHSTEYLSFVSQLSKQLERKLETQSSYMVDHDNEDQMDSASTTKATTKWGLPVSSSSLTVVPFTPMVQRSMIKIAESNVKLSDNSDTSFSVGSLRAARRAAGAVQHAIDCVVTGKSRNSFCVVRPPGHHAGVNGLLEGGESCGFCIFNNVAAGAMHALAEYKDVCQRVAIVDIDVHHGNGTEEIVRKCNDPSTLFFFSIHLFDNDDLTAQSKRKNHQMYKFYPGTGCNDDLAMNIINVPIMPLWKDMQSKSSASMEPKTHNTRKKLRSNAISSFAQPESNNDDSSEPSTPHVVATTSSSRHSDGESSTATATQQSSNSHNNGIVPMTTSVAGTVLTLPGRMAYRQAITSRLLPSLRAFNPNLILISAGFDASSGDVGNARHEKDRERMGMDLSPDDYAWTTRQILQIADICCQGRVVSVLEGGYGRTPLSEATAAQCDTQTAAATTLDRQIFGECAIRHLHALIDPYDVEQRF